jgi:prefoldin subunit 5
MTRIDQIKSDLRLAKRLKVIQETEVDIARRRWEEAVERREKTEQHMQSMLQELWQYYGQIDSVAYSTQPK